MFKKRTINLINSKHFIMCLLFSAVLSIIGCESKFDEYWQAENPKGGFIYTRLKDDPQFSTFARGLDITNLTRFVDRSGLYTVFAPTNEAFENYLKNAGYATLEDVPQATLSNILSYHITHNMFYYYDFNKRFKDSREETYLTRNKKFVTIDVRSEGFKVNGVNIIPALRDIDAENGVIHGVGEVLVPRPNLELVLKNDPGFSTFYKLLQPMAAEEYDEINSFDMNRDGRIDSVFYRVYERLFSGISGPAVEFVAGGNFGFSPVFYTVLVPSNNVLNSYLAPILPKFKNSIDSLPQYYVEALMESYFIGGREVPSSELIARPTIINAINNERVPALSAANIVRPDIRASNGLAHEINVMFPIASRLRGGIGVAMTDPDLKMFMIALEESNLMSTYSSPTKAATYFAPTNAAFKAAGLVITKTRVPRRTTITLNGATISAQQLGNILRHHILNSDRSRSSLTNGNQATDYTGTSITITNNGARVVSNSGITANLVGDQIRGISLPNENNVVINYNGFVHKIDALLLPTVY